MEALMNSRYVVRSLSTNLIAACLLLGAGAATAGIDLRWSPGDTTVVSVNATRRLSIHLDEAVRFRTIEVSVTYDTTVIRSLGGGPGALFADSEYFVFDGFEERPNGWHGFAVVMGAGDYLTGPGELLTWDIAGVSEGTTVINSVAVHLYDEASPPNLIQDVVLGEATIIVQSPASVAGELPAVAGVVRVAPNPFNPRTRISCDVAQDTRARLSVFDVRGRRVARLHDGLAAAGTFSVDWDGTDDHGVQQPSGIYLFQLVTDYGTAQASGFLAK
jgi:hypothetical protein